ncbi:MAG: DUF362 domain-containing protein [Anaerolineales bacterium]|nr:DUF362 domain-containing protein [Anaerolineales bacterium]MCB8963210.1 DUF362 domain-containing protein [Ardenticatenales bacterium]
MKRRDFCRQAVLLGGAVALSPLMKGCSPADELAAVTAQQPTALPPIPTATDAPTRPSPTAMPASPTTQPTAAPTDAAPTATPEAEPTLLPAMGTVALVRTLDRAYGVQRAVRLLGVNPLRGNRVLLKPNYNSADPAPSSTHLDILRALVLEMEGMGARSITLGERSGMGDTRAVLSETGVYGLARELGFATILFNEMDEKEWVSQQSTEYHWESGFAVPKILLDSECVVQTCNLKTHGYGGHFTMSLKNSVGFVPRTLVSGGYNFMTELHASPYQREMIAEINMVYQPSLIVMDGVKAFVDGGPAQGTVVTPGVVLASQDRLAIDAVGVAILRLFGTIPEVSQGRIFAQTQLARAAELGLGVTGPEQIQIVTEDAESEAFAGLVRRLL